MAQQGGRFFLQVSTSVNRHHIFIRGSRFCYSISRAKARLSIERRTLSSPTASPIGAEGVRCASAVARTGNNRLSVAIVGAGPSGFYTAKYLRSALGRVFEAKCDEGASPLCEGVDIDMIEKLPTPYGLVRSGVAPDHPEVKNVQNDFDSLFDESGSESSLSFVGNVAAGKDVSLAELRSLYNIVVLSYGCESDRKLGIEGEDLRGVLSAREFVAWYNGHPDFVHVGSEIEDLLSHPETAQVVVIGQGNVALDCARILAKGRPGLVDTDIASHALPLLDGGMEKITVCGRRGHIQGAFTIKELRELTKLDAEGHDTAFVVRADELNMGTTAATLEELKGAGSRPKLRIDKLLRDVASSSSEKRKALPKQIDLRFLLNPVKFAPSVSDSSIVGSVICERTRLEGDPGRQVAIGTGEMETIPADLVLVSIGYRGVPLYGMAKGVFNDTKGIVQNNHGRVFREDGLLEYGLYVSGWLKRGPSGIIGTNISDAKDTVNSILNDVGSGKVSCEKKAGREGLKKILCNRGITTVDWKSFQKINLSETDAARRRSDAQPREKIVSLQQMLQLIT